MPSTVSIRPPLQLLGTSIQDPSNAENWKLYDMSKVWTQNNDVAAQNPDQIKKMQDKLWKELAKY
jgi:arylsulfatase